MIEPNRSIHVKDVDRTRNSLIHLRYTVGKNSLSAETSLRSTFAFNEVHLYLKSSDGAKNNCEPVPLLTFTFKAV